MAIQHRDVSGGACSRSTIMRLGRRDLLRGTAAGAGMLVMGGCSTAPQAPSGAFDPYEKVLLGKTKIQVSRVGFGTGMRGGNRQSNQTRMGKERLETLLREAYDRGVRYFDLADMYGSHPFVAGALAKVPRDSYVLLTKMWVMRGGLPEPERPDADVVVERFRKELKTDYVDVVLIHCMTDPQWPEKQKRQMDNLAALKAKGLIRAHGVSIHSLPALEACVDEPWVDSVNARINAYGVSMDDKDAGKVAAVLRRMREKGKGVVGMKLVGEGRFRDDPEKKDGSVRFVLERNLADTMAVGFESIAEVDDFAGRVKKVKRG
jgi:aryl-alcohol dehydrogenase-like predicted oxidoreductase